MFVPCANGALSTSRAEISAGRKAPLRCEDHRHGPCLKKNAPGSRPLSRSSNLQTSGPTYGVPFVPRFDEGGGHLGQERRGGAPGQSARSSSWTMTYSEGSQWGRRADGLAGGRGWEESVAGGEDCVSGDWERNVADH